MRLPEDFDEQNSLSNGMLKMMIAACVFIVAIFVLVLVINQEKEPTVPTVSMEQLVSADESIESGSGSPDDFDFWDMYGESTESVEESTTEESTTEEDPATDGRHTKITYPSGEEEWVLISPYLEKHTYDFTKLVSQADRMKYFEEGNEISYVGADISKHQDYVDFLKLKKAGIDFVMIRVGARGYGTGELIMDEYFDDNIKRATDAGLPVGLYFSSQAVTEEEAVEEAELVLKSIGDYDIAYPIAIDMEYVRNDTARTDKLTRAERTRLVQTFMDTILVNGYLPIVYGDKEWLLKKVDLSKLSGYDVWLSQPGDMPDYPYQFTMWQYNKSAEVDGIAGYVNLNLSFIDYTEK